MIFKSTPFGCASALLLTQIALALVGCAGSTATQPATGGGVRQSDQSQEAVYSEQQRNYIASLDTLRSEHNYTKLADAVLSSPDASLIVPTLDWGKSRTMAGASLIVPLLYATKLWLVGSANSQYASLRETAGLITIYALMVTYADGVKCADQTAPGHRIDAILAQHRDPLKMLAVLPVDRRATLIAIAARMETATAPLRTNDNYLCRFGMQETIDDLKKHEGKELQELPPQSGQVGKLFRIPDDPDYEPIYIPREQWEPKQQTVRDKFVPVFTTLLDAVQDTP
jgi:hypothetical protein